MTPKDTSHVRNGERKRRKEDLRRRKHHHWQRQPELTKKETILDWEGEEYWDRLKRDRHQARQERGQPTKECIKTKSNILIFTRTKQPTLRWPREDQGEGEKKEERKTEMLVEQGEWVEGCDEEDNDRYRTFLKYCEKRRMENKRQRRRMRIEKERL